jgi:hypothetical protein
MFLHPAHPSPGTELFRGFWHPASELGRTATRLLLGFAVLVVGSPLLVLPVAVLVNVLDVTDVVAGVWAVTVLGVIGLVGMAAGVTALLALVKSRDTTGSVVLALVAFVPALMAFAFAVGEAVSPH